MPRDPVHAEEYGAEARRIVDEGGVHIHIHARKPDGTPSYEIEDFVAISEAIRSEVGDDVIVNFSTGTVGVPVEKRIAYLEAGRPEVAALNMGSMNYAKYSKSRKDFVFKFVFQNPFEEIIELLKAMHRLGIKPEHECFDIGHVGSLAPLVDMGLLEAPLHADFVMGVVGGIPATARNLAAMADNMPPAPDGGRRGNSSLGRDRHRARAVDAGRRGAHAGGLGPRRARGQLLPAGRHDGALERGADREGTADDRGPRAPAGDRGGGAGVARGRPARNGVSTSAEGMLKMSELAERSGVSAGTIKHYLREGLLGDGDEIKRTSRNMAYYPEDFVERIRLIKRLQEDRFMPLRLIREVMAEEPERAARMVEIEDRILERAIEARESGRTSRARVRETYDVPANVLERLEELEVLTPNARGYDADDIQIIEAISRFRAGGYEEAIGFTVYDTLRYREALQPLVEEEVAVLLGRLAGQVEVDRAVEIIASGTQPLRGPDRRDALEAAAGGAAPPARPQCLTVKLVWAEISLPASSLASTRMKAVTFLCLESAFLTVFSTPEENFSLTVSEPFAAS